jgi:putative restriction endonuclease
MNGYIGNTDLEWHALLLARQRSGLPVDEVNFWKPSETANFKALRPGEPFFFRLKSPANAIGGVGFFERFSILPAWLAWDTFGVANGVRTLPELEARLREIRARNHIDARGELRIGCILLVDPVFFGIEEWVQLPDDWKPKTVSGATYDLSEGEGARMWRECQERLVQRRVPLAADRPLGERYGPAVLTRPRLGQGGFRIAVIDAYDKACAVTTEHSLPALEAAHIRPYADEGAHEVPNGLLLRSDIHRLFDRGYVTVTPDYRFRVSERLRDDYANGKTYYALHDRRIVTPSNPAHLPSRDALAWHAEQRFLR